MHHATASGQGGNCCGGPVNGYHQGLAVTERSRKVSLGESSADIRPFRATLRTRTARCEKVRAAPSGFSLLQEELTDRICRLRLSIWCQAASGGRWAMVTGQAEQ